METGKDWKDIKNELLAHLEAVQTERDLHIFLVASAYATAKSIVVKNE